MPHEHRKRSALFLQEKCFADLIVCTNGNSTRGECIQKLKDCLQNCRKVQGFHNVSNKRCNTNNKFQLHQLRFCEASFLITKVKGLKQYGQHLPRIFRHRTGSLKKQGNRFGSLECGKYWHLEKWITNAVYTLPYTLYL